MLGYMRFTWGILNKYNIGQLTNVIIKDKLKNQKKGDWKSYKNWKHMNSLFSGKKIQKTVNIWKTQLQ